MKADSVKVTRLLKTARGQIDGIIKMVERDEYCLDISHQILACEAILKKVNLEIVRSHMESCVADAFACGSTQDTSQKIGELVDLMNRMMK